MIHSIKHCLCVAILLGVGEALVGYVLGKEFGKLGSQETHGIDMVHEDLDCLTTAPHLGKDQWGSIISQAINISFDFDEGRL